MLRAVRVEGLPTTRGAARFGLSRPACYKAIRAFEAGGFLALLPDKPGPRQAHKLVPEVLAFLADARARDPATSSNELVRLARQRFALVVHPRSIARALARREKNVVSGPRAMANDADFTPRYGALRGGMGQHDSGQRQALLSWHVPPTNFSSKHLPRYLAEFSYRFSRRFSLTEMFPRLAFVALRTAPMPYRVLKLAENYF